MKKEQSWRKHGCTSEQSYRDLKSAMDASLGEVDMDNEEEDRKMITHVERRGNRRSILDELLEEGEEIDNESNDVADIYAPIPRENEGNDPEDETWAPIRDRQTIMTPIQDVLDDEGEDADDTEEEDPGDTVSALPNRRSYLQQAKEPSWKTAGCSSEASYRDLKMAMSAFGDVSFGDDDGTNTTTSNTAAAPITPYDQDIMNEKKSKRRKTWMEYGCSSEQSYRNLKEVTNASMGDVGADDLDAVMPASAQSANAEREFEEALDASIQASAAAAGGGGGGQDAAAAAAAATVKDAKPAATTGGHGSQESSYKPAAKRGNRRKDVLNESNTEETAAANASGNAATRRRSSGADIVASLPPLQTDLDAKISQRLQNKDPSAVRKRANRLKEKNRKAKSRSQAHSSIDLPIPTPEEEEQALAQALYASTLNGSMNDDAALQQAMNLSLGNGNMDDDEALMQALELSRAIIDAEIAEDDDGQDEPVLSASNRDDAILSASIWEIGVEAPPQPKKEKKKKGRMTMFGLPFGKKANAKPAESDEECPDIIVDEEKLAEDRILKGAKSMYDDPLMLDDPLMIDAISPPATKKDKKKKSKDDLRSNSRSKSRPKSREEHSSPKPVDESSDVVDVVKRAEDMMLKGAKMMHENPLMLDDIDTSTKKEKKKKSKDDDRSSSRATSRSKSRGDELRNSSRVKSRTKDKDELRSSRVKSKDESRSSSRLKSKEESRGSSRVKSRSTSKEELRSSSKTKSRDGSKKDSAEKVRKPKRSSAPDRVDSQDEINDSDRHEDPVLMMDQLKNARRERKKQLQSSVRKPKEMPQQDGTGDGDAIRPKGLSAPDKIEGVKDELSDHLSGHAERKLSLDERILMKKLESVKNLGEDLDLSDAQDKLTLDEKIAMKANKGGEEKKRRGRNKSKILQSFTASLKISSSSIGTIPTANTSDVKKPRSNSTPGDENASDNDYLAPRKHSEHEREEEIASRRKTHDKMIDADPLLMIDSLMDQVKKNGDKDRSKRKTRLFGL
jgi:hypothetical protein